MIFEDVPERLRRAENLLCPSLVNQPSRGHRSNNLYAGLGREVVERIHLSQSRGARAPNRTGRDTGTYRLGVRTEARRATV